MVPCLCHPPDLLNFSVTLDKIFVRLIRTLRGGGVRSWRNVELMLDPAESSSHLVEKCGKVVTGYRAYLLWGVTGPVGFMAGNSPSRRSCRDDAVDEVFAWPCSKGMRRLDRVWSLEESLKSMVLVRVMQVGRYVLLYGGFSKGVRVFKLPECQVSRQTSLPWVKMVKRGDSLLWIPGVTSVLTRYEHLRASLYPPQLYPHPWFLLDRFYVRKHLRIILST